MTQTFNFLLVDDDPVFLAVAETVLQSLGHNVAATATDGERGVGALTQARSPVDMIILDLNMPNLDGLAFMRSAAKSGFAGQIIISSGESEAVIRSAQRMGEMLGVRICGALKKPIQRDALAELLEQCRRRPLVLSSDVTPPLVPDLGAVSEGSIVPYYQPQYLVETRSVAGLEALVRIEMPDGQVHGPGHLFGQIHDHDELVRVSLSIARKVLADMARWRVGGPDCRVSINMDAGVLEEPHVVPALIEMVRESGVPASLVCVELTETRLPSDMTRLIEVLARLRMAGFELSLDDYGTGSSNYELLRLCPFTELKIDASIIRSAAREPYSKRFLDTAVAMAKDLGLAVIAEGVETVAQLELCSKAGISIIQGFLFARALNASEAHRLVIGKAAKASDSPFKFRFGNLRR
jgi:EAL domain-containing protein (putative c-di-GMP-specific phosphodiesterase class I)/ActR/RegA family two-component response regulator